MSLLPIPKSIQPPGPAGLPQHRLFRHALRSDLGLSVLLCLVIGGLAWVLHSQMTPPFQGSESLPTSTQGRADALVVLAGEPDRWIFAGTLLDEGYAPRALSTLSDPACLKLGRTDGECATRVRNTVDEAIAMRRILADAYIARVTVVTSDYHALRTGAIFAVVFAGSRIDFDILGAPSPRPDKIGLYWHELVSLGPSLVGAVLSRISPALYEELLVLRYSLPH